MYDRRLEAIVASAELGSFSKAAARLHVSTPALVKQVRGFEDEHGISLFERSHAGVTPTSAGSIIVEDARTLMRFSKDSMQRARAAMGEGSAVRLGISLMCPGRNTIELWPHIHDLEPSLRLEIVPVGDLYDNRQSVMTHLGRDVDVVQSSYSHYRWGDSCKLLKIFNAEFAVDVPRSWQLARRKRLSLNDLRGKRIRILRHGNEEMDELRNELLASGDVQVIDVDNFDFALFNDAIEKNDAVLTSGAWSGIHPSFVAVPLTHVSTVACYLAYSPNPSPQVRRFVRAMHVVLERHASKSDV